MSAAHQGQQQQPERLTIASLAPPQRTQAEAECKRQSSQGLLIGAGASLGVSYVLHKLLEANSPAYVTLSRNAKYAAAIGQTPHSHTPPPSPLSISRQPHPLTSPAPPPSLPPSLPVLLPCPLSRQG